ncbi:TPA: flagellar basal body rod protein FlgC [Candidatus Scatenecus faecavium]|uniref:Flagellar basal body rod protein FlgC n=1 Tax=Candidatus Scatenecus faecavium TaxID=2840915 RepID=A0A9D1K3X5_9BACT|nr:flagellar basal body rod protein FlgC [Candidatus Scatenecus faecavium]
MSLMGSMDIGQRALRSHGLRLDVHSRNMANVDTPNYVRRIPILNATEEISFHGVLNEMKEDVFGIGTLQLLQGGVVFNGCIEDPTLGEKIYKPGHPDADENGYIRASNVNPMVEMADAIMAQRAYEANLALVNITKSMASRATEIGR